MFAAASRTQTRVTDRLHIQTHATREGHTQQRPELSNRRSQWARPLCSGRHSRRTKDKATSIRTIFLFFYMSDNPRAHRQRKKDLLFQHSLGPSCAAAFVTAGHPRSRCKRACLFGFARFHYSGIFTNKKLTIDQSAGHFRFLVASAALAPSAARRAVSYSASSRCGRPPLRRRHPHPRFPSHGAR